jgi:hypothetical protein
MKQTHRSVTWALVAVVVVGAMVSAAEGSQLWGGRSQPFRIDPATGAVGAGSTYNPGGIADTASDTARWPTLIWGVNGSTSPNVLSAFDPVKGTLAYSVNLALPASNDPIRGLAIDPVTGDFYGASSLALFKLDPWTGARTLVGATPMRIDDALGFDAAGVLYGVTTNEELVTVDKGTATLTKVGNLAINAVFDLATRPEDGVMHAPAYSNTAGYLLTTIDTSNAALQVKGPSYTRPQYLAFTGVPESGSMALLMVGCALMSAGVRRRSEAA